VRSGAVALGERACLGVVWDAEREVCLVTPERSPAVSNRRPEPLPCPALSSLGGPPVGTGSPSSVSVSGRGGLATVVAQLLRPV
jgi:hypothetical protein